MKKSPHRHRARSIRRRQSWSSNMHTWRVRRARQVAELEAMPPGPARSMVESLMQTKAIAMMDVLSGFVDPREDNGVALTTMRHPRSGMPEPSSLLNEDALVNDITIDTGMLAPGTTVEITGASAWQWTADDGFKVVIG